MLKSPRHPGRAAASATAPCWTAHGSGVLVPSLLIVVAGLDKVDSIVADDIDEAMLLGEPPGPDIGAQILEWFGFADPAERLAHDGFDEGKNSESCAPISLDPIAQVVAKLGLKHRIALRGRWNLAFTLFRQALPRGADRQSIAVPLSAGGRALKRLVIVPH